MVVVPVEAGVLEYATAAVTRAGEAQTGDQYLVTSARGGHLLAVIDAVGHGSDAAKNAAIAAAGVVANADKSLTQVVQICHDALKRTSGVVISLAFFDPKKDALAWLAVGNVEAILVRNDKELPREYIVMRGGVVGAHLPALHCDTVAVQPKDTLIFATDGVRLEFEHDLCVSRPLQELADDICVRYYNGTDDALVLVARFRGGTA
jgi:phosphoserine phosphatase RsbX